MEGAVDGEGVDASYEDFSGADDWRGELDAFGAGVCSVGGCALL